MRRRAVSCKRAHRCYRGNNDIWVVITKPNDRIEDMGMSFVISPVMKKCDQSVDTVRGGQGGMEWDGADRLDKPGPATPECRGRDNKHRQAERYSEAASLY